MELQNVTIAYTPLPYQRQLHDDPHRFKVIVAGRRVGKTTFAINELIKLAVIRNLPIHYWYLAPYTYQAKEIAWQMLLRYVPKELLAKRPLESELTLKLVNGATVALKGSDNPLGLEGIALGALIVDEVAAINHFQSLWEYTLRPMLADYQSPAIFISKPRGFNRFYDLAKQGDHRNLIEGESAPGVRLQEDYITYRFETEQNCKQHNNGYIDHEEIETAKRQLTPEAFDQEYRAKFTNYTGVVHKLFSRSTHIIPDFLVPPDWERLRGWDFGSAHPTATLRIAIDPDGNWFIEHCYKEKEKSIDYHAEYIKRQDAELGAVVSGFGDPSGKQWITELNNKGVDIRPAKKQENTNEKNWVQLGIDKLNEKLQPKEGHFVLLPNGRKLECAPSFFILDRPENYALVNELEALTYKETQSGINNAVLDDTRDKYGHFDLHAALRYALVSLPTNIFYQSIGPEEAQRQIIDQAKDRDIKETLKDKDLRKPLERAADLEIMRKAQKERGIW